MKNIDNLGVLFVDDERALLDGINRIARKCRPSWKLLFSSSIPDAIDVIKDRSKEIDVCVCDISMPILSGLDVLRILKTVYPNIVRITYSGQLDGITLIRSDRVSEDHVVKPMPTEDLCDVITKAYLSHWQRCDLTSQ